MPHTRWAAIKARVKVNFYVNDVKYIVQQDIHVPIFDLYRLQNMSSLVLE